MDEATLTLDRIVLAVAGVETYEPSLKIGVDLARATGASLHLVHAWNYGGVAGWPMDYSTPVSADEDLERRANETMLTVRKAADKLLGRRSLAHVERGTPANAILRVAEQVGADLIITSGHTRHGTAAVFLGSVSERVLEAARCAVLVVHGNGINWPPAEVIACADDSDQAKLATLFAALMANAFQVPLRTLHVVQRSDEAGSDAQSPVSTFKGRPMPVLSREIGSHPRAIVTMGTSGRGAVPMTRIGSVAMHLLRTTNAPLLIVPPAAVAGHSGLVAAGNR
jgi:nucleotide-binding universal stress UspA family protein